MAKTLDFTKRKKEFLTVKLNDEDTTVLAVNMPKKYVYECLLECVDIFEQIDQADDTETITSGMNALYEACALALSNNKQKKEFTAEEVAKFFDFEDLVVFFTAYLNFVDESSKAKN